MKTYKVIDGTSFDENTPDAVCNAINRALKSRERVQIWYGEDGKSWNDEHDMHGRFWRSMGPRKIPLMILTRRSTGGGAVLDHCIIRIYSLDQKRDLYRAPDYVPSVFTMRKSDMEGYTNEVHINGEFYSRHKSERSAKMLIAKMHKA